MDSEARTHRRRASSQGRRAVRYFAHPHLDFLIVQDHEQVTDDLGADLNAAVSLTYAHGSIIEVFATPDDADAVDAHLAARGYRPLGDDLHVAVAALYDDENAA